MTDDSARARASHVHPFRHRRRGASSPLGYLMLLAVAAGALPARTSATVSLGAWTQHSPDDIGGFATLTNDNNTATATIPFNVTIEGTSYTTVTISTNGWLEFGGNTQGTSHPANVCLPTSTHTNPFLAAYWDDLNPFGTTIRYGTVGTSPGRTFIVDFEVDLTSGSEGADDLRFQVQVHETSNLINVRYRDQQSATNGIAATIGFQGAGGASGTALPLTCNGKVLDDNRSDEGWSVDASRAGNMVLSAFMAHSPDDINTTNIPGLLTLSGNDTTATPTMPFSVTIDAVSYNTVTISTNGWLELGGNTSGSSDPANTSLPASNHTNPFIAAYWDDMQTQGTNIRYGTVGTSPNRTFIVDFEGDVVAQGGSDLMRYQVQIHEGSSLINIKYRDTQVNANGTAATIGFQGAGGASAAPYPLTFNGRILDDNTPNEGWSVFPQASGAMSLHAIMEHSPDDISGFTTLTGDNAIAGVTMPFSITLDGTSYTQVTIGTNGLIQFGTTTGANPTGNTALPSASFPNPTLFYYWDDMQTINTGIRYGTVGTSPNRTFIVDFDIETTVGTDNGSDDVTGQVEIHERSNVINVKYTNNQVSVGGQTGTIGFQGAGGASATPYPLTFNGKIMDDNLPQGGWSIAPLPVCGNGTLDGSVGEQCDLGSANGAFSCCTSQCEFRAAGQTCRASVASCDAPETCTGSSSACPADAVEPSGTICRPSAGDCDIAEVCSGTAPGCPFFDTKSTGVCRPAAGGCDVAESCNGITDNCPADAFTPAGTLCRASTGACDPLENCTGSGPACPADVMSPAGTVCRNSAGFCDVAETCNGVSGACPADGFQPSSLECRASAGDCDVAENCTGSGPNCPADAFQPSSVECRASAGVCDIAENCTGSGPNCPADSVAGAFVECRASAGPCDQAENCPSVGVNCPPDVVTPAGTVCRASVGTCDVAESCDGVATTCPPDGFAPSSTLCRGAAGSCDVAENCTGSSNACPVDAFQPIGTMCRAAAGICDVQEVCSGLSGACPADLTLPNGTPCDDTNMCTSPDTCQSGICTGTPLGNCTDHYLCYKGRRQSAFPGVLDVHLVDQFEDIRVDVKKLRDICTPAEKNGEPVLDPATHLINYSFKVRSGTPRFVRRTNVRVDNQLTGSPFRIDIFKRDTLYVPANKSLVSPTTPPTTNVDHYKCYRAKSTPGQPRFQAQNVNVIDQFTGPTAKIFTVKRLRSFCTPVDKNGEGIINADAHLACYQVKALRGQPRHVRRTGVNTADQFGSLLLGTIRENLLCIPSTKTLLP